MSEIQGSDVIATKGHQKLIIRHWGERVSIGEVLTMNMPSFGIEGRWLVENSDEITETVQLRRVEEIE